MTPYTRPWTHTSRTSASSVKRSPSVTTRLAILPSSIVPWLRDSPSRRAGVVVSALDPRRTFMQLVDPRELPGDLVDGINRYKFQGVSAKVNFALDGLPTYPPLGKRGDQYRGFINIAPTMNYLERAFDDAKYGWYSSHPYIDGAIQSTIDPDMAPPGNAPGGEDWPFAPEPRMEEGPGREGDEIPISPNEAGRLLESLNLDRGRSLPMDFSEEAKPEDRKEGRDW